MTLSGAHWFDNRKSYCKLPSVHQQLAECAEDLAIIYFHYVIICPLLNTLSIRGFRVWGSGLNRVHWWYRGMLFLCAMLQGCAVLRLLTAVTTRKSRWALTTELVSKNYSCRTFCVCEACSHQNCLLSMPRKRKNPISVVYKNLSENVSYHLGV